MPAPARPKVTIPRTRIELALELVGLTTVVGMAAFALRAWPTLPDVVPVHFGLNGRPDAWGRRDSLVFLLGLSFGLYGLLSVLDRVPHAYNYPVPVTAENARRLYLLGRQLVVAVKVIVAGSFAALFFAVVLISRGQLETLSAWYLPAVLLSLGIALCVAIVRMRREGGAHD